MTVPPKSNYIAEQWDSFVAAVFDEPVPVVQLQEMRRAFYAGAQALFSVIMNIADSDLGSAEEDQEVQHLAAIHDELGRFMNDLMAGKA